MREYIEKVVERIKRINPVILLAVFSLLLLLNISKQYLWTDEVFSYHAAQMIVEKGQPIYDSGLNYSRAPIYHQLLAALFKVFGDSVFLSRAINVIFSFVTSVFIYSFFKDKNRHLGIITALLFLTTNFTLATVRETRMYSMAAMFLIASVYYLYTAIRAFNPKESIQKNANRNVIVPLIPALILLIAAYYTHPSIAAIGFGIIFFLFIWAILERSWMILILLVVAIGLAMLSMYWQYSSINILEIIERASPIWATRDFSKIYYSILLTRNLPILLLCAPLIVYNVFKRKLLTIFSSSIFLGYLVFISLQPAQQERYLSLLIPLSILLIGSSFEGGSISGLLNTHLRKESRFKNLLPKLYKSLLAIAIAFHIGLYIKEQLEIDTYTPTSISIHKKFKFNDLMSLLKENESNIEILADYHSAFTLHFYGFDVKGIIVQKDHPDLLRGDTDIYFNKPFYTYESVQLINEIADPEKDIIVIRDLRDLQLLDLDSEEFERLLIPSVPAVYEER